MSTLEQLREEAGLGGVLAPLANEILVIHENYTNGELSREEFEFLLEQIASVRAQQDLAQDEIACRWIVSAVSALISLTP